MAIKTIINGVESTMLSVDDRGLHYGDGLFETILVSNQQPQLWEEHLARLFLGCEKLAIIKPHAETLYEECLTLCQGQEKAVLKILITRGSGGRGYRPLTLEHAREPTRIIQLHPYPSYPAENWQKGIHLRLCQTPISEHPVLAGIKHINRLENVLARSEWNDEDIAEGVMTNQAGHWIEGTMSNIFLARAGKLYTPDLSRCGVQGIMRQQVIKLADQLGIPCETCAIDNAFVQSVDEIFVTNSAIGLWPVRQFEENTYQIGPISTQLRKTLIS